MRRLVFSLCLILCLTEASFAAGGAKKSVKKGNLLYNKGDYEKALDAYEEALIESPDSDIVNYNIGGALYKNNNYEAAVNHLEKSLVSDSDELQQKASYNLGNAEYKAATQKEGEDLEGAIALMRSALRHYGRAIELDSEDEDAKYNYEFVKKELERLEQKMQSMPEESRKEESKEEETEEKKEQTSGEGSLNRDESGAEGETGAKEKMSKEQKDEKGGSVEDAEEPSESGDTGEKSDERKGEMSEEEARMLLEIYDQEEEPRTLYREKMPVRNMPDVSKDW
ncbi:MAG: tetratricopeptide repeat protein [Candidatus Omnitrophica bacterium]|nr:tetratricopeptide repeat protein [Candidatus Omnitrophota bacterium]